MTVRYFRLIGHTWCSELQGVDWTIQGEEGGCIFEVFSHLQHIHFPPSTVSVVKIVLIIRQPGLDGGVLHS